MVSTSGAGLTRSWMITCAEALRRWNRGKEVHPHGIRAIMNLVLLGSMLTDCGHQRPRFRCLYGSLLKTIAHNRARAIALAKIRRAFRPGRENPLSGQNYNL